MKLSDYVRENNPIIFDIAFNYMLKDHIEFVKIFKVNSLDKLTDDQFNYWLGFVTGRVHKDCVELLDGWGGGS